MYSHLPRVLIVGLATPLVGFAQSQGANLSYLQNAAEQVQSLVEQLIPLAIAIALLVFIWGLVQFIFASGNEEARKEGVRRIVWGVITLFVIVSVWGLVGLLNELTGIEQGTPVEVPRLIP